MMRPLSLLKASSRRTASSTGADAVPRQAYSSSDETEGILASMLNLLGMRVLRRAWTVCRLTGSLHSPHAEPTSWVTSHGPRRGACSPHRHRDHDESHHSSLRRRMLWVARRISIAS